MFNLGEQLMSRVVVLYYSFWYGGREKLKMEGICGDRLILEARRSDETSGRKTVDMVTSFDRVGHA